MDIFTPAYEGALAYLQKETHATEGAEPEAELMRVAMLAAIVYMNESRNSDLWLSAALKKFGINVLPADVGDFTISICTLLQD
jgi:hypothetical protein